MKMTVVSSITTKFVSPMINKLSKEQINNIFNAQNMTFQFIETKKLEKREEGFFSILLLIDDETFNTNITTITNNIRRFYSQNKEILFADYFVSAAARVVKACDSPGAFAGCFYDAFAQIGSLIFTNRVKATEILSKVCGEGFSYETVSSEAQRSMRAYYSAFITNVINAASSLSSLSIEDLNILGEIMKPVSETTDKKELMDSYTKLLVGVAASQNSELSNLAISLIANLAIVSE